MKILVVGKRASITHWLEDCVAAWQADGHNVKIAITRNPAIHPAIEGLLRSKVLGAPQVRRIRRIATRFLPDLIVVVGAFHAPQVILEELAEVRAHAPMIGWVGDLFGDEAGASATLLDAVAYTDSGLVALHHQRQFQAPAFYLPHAVRPYAGDTQTWPRKNQLVFVANPTEHRRNIVDGLRQPISLYGPGWTPSPGVAHTLNARRIANNSLGKIYGQHIASLNIRNEHNVLTGLNQRNFAPYLSETAVLTEHQDDLELCFEPGREVLVYRNLDELNELHARILRAPEEAAAVGRAGHARVMATHTYANRLEAMLRMV